MRVLFLKKFGQNVKDDHLPGLIISTNFGSPTIVFGGGVTQLLGGNWILLPSTHFFVIQFSCWLEVASSPSSSSFTNTDVLDLRLSHIDSVRSINSSAKATLSVLPTSSLSLITSSITNAEVVDTFGILIAPSYEFSTAPSSLSSDGDSTGALLEVSVLILLHDLDCDNCGVVSTVESAIVLTAVVESEVIIIDIAACDTFDSLLFNGFIAVSIADIIACGAGRTKYNRRSGTNSSSDCLHHCIVFDTSRAIT